MTSDSQDVDFDTFNDAARSILNNGEELPEVSPQTLVATLRSVVQGEDRYSTDGFFWSQASEEFCGSLTFITFNYCRIWLLYVVVICCYDVFICRFTDVVDFFGFRQLQPVGRSLITGECCR